MNNRAITYSSLVEDVPARLELVRIVWADRDTARMSSNLNSKRFRTSQFRSAVSPERNQEELSLTVLAPIATAAASASRIRPLSV